ncbi:hypothetical protein L1267_23420 [Pseudoalteromonas sp. OFAV1]|jgi:hypothetical protein|uniref:hypothetical protein n=1 Tax=Pseudoalteromonas sp. OFAV1 TaxID=2908892 RepID=UPI001F244F30|nr:hypothetical protein [Pseudoalteromonas sp. OFAV1]MCF2903322.1 hypothetical protein [Pseudoalteromonas sp. OFAV1]
MTKKIQDILKTKDLSSVVELTDDEVFSICRSIKCSANIDTLISSGNLLSNIKANNNLFEISLVYEFYNKFITTRALHNNIAHFLSECSVFDGRIDKDKLLTLLKFGAITPISLIHSISSERSIMRNLLLKLLNEN